MVFILAPHLPALSLSLSPCVMRLIFAIFGFSWAVRGRLVPVSDLSWNDDDVCDNKVGVCLTRKTMTHSRQRHATRQWATTNSSQSPLVWLPSSFIGGNEPSLLRLVAVLPVAIVAYDRTKKRTDILLQPVLLSASSLELAGIPAVASQHIPFDNNLNAPVNWCNKGIAARRSPRRSWSHITCLHTRLSSSYTSSRAPSFSFEGLRPFQVRRMIRNEFAQWKRKKRRHELKP